MSNFENIPEFKLDVNHNKLLKELADLIPYNGLKSA